MQQFLGNLDLCGFIRLGQQFNHRVGLVGQTNVNADFVLGCGHLGGFLVISKQVWPDLLEVFDPRFGDSVGSPLRYSALCYVAKLSNERSAAKPIDDFVIVHAESIAHYTATVQHALPIKV